MPDFQLNEQQSTGLRRIPGMQDYFLLQGYAGTGKTTVITEYIKQQKRTPNMVLTAPTNKATGVLRKMADERNLRVEVSTIHSLLALKMKWEEDKQVLVPNPKVEPRFHEFDQVVIDECSMLDEELMGYICRAQKEACNQIIFMGDPCQLPPINEKHSRSFGVPDKVELTQVMRQAEGNNIVALGIYLRELILGPRPAYPAKLFEFVDSKTIFYHPLEKYEGEILDRFADEDELDLRHVAWTNKVVDSWNNKIRDRLYGYDREEWVEGEDIVTTAPVMCQYENKILFATDTLLTIEREPQIVTKEDVECWKLVCEREIMYVPLRTSGKQVRERRDALVAAAKEDKRKWREFYKFVETFSSIKPAHSLTVHRSQGSTFDDVYVSFANILANPRRKESLQCLYVAATRPRSRLFLV